MKNRLLKTASAITALSVAERGLGFLYRILLSRLIGAEGLGLYQVSLSLFSLFLTIGTGGLPITLSRIITKHRAENNPHGESGVTAAGILLSAFLTLPIAIIFLIFGQHFTFLFADERAFSVFRILLLGLTFSSIYAVVRGWFWGRKQLLLPSVIEIVEESAMVIAGVLLLQSISSPLDGAQKAAWAVIISYLCSFTISLLCFFFAGGRLSSPKKQLKPLFNATLPITSVRAGSSLVNSAIAILLPAMLIRAGYNETQALELFGVVSGMALPVLFIPSTLIGSISLVLVPELSEDFYRKNFSRLLQNIRRGLRVAFLIACALLPFFYALGEDLGLIAFASPLAGEMIQKSCLLLLPMSISMIATGILNSLGFERQTFLFYFIGAAVMLLCILFLPPLFGVYAYIVGLIASFSINALLCLYLLHKKCHIFKKQREQVRDKTLFRALLFILPLSILGQFFHVISKQFFGELLSVLFTAAILSLCLFLLYFLAGILPKKTLSSFFLSRKKKDSAFTK
ncbi:MAG: oligosaccharide flippase family protein [Clostridia bacterium]|nr:oligosaccharide flippase family protein [Clostridia bacterium]